MASCKFWIYISSEGPWQWMPNRQGALIPKAVSVPGSRTLPHCCTALKIFCFFIFSFLFFCSGGMKVIICFWVTSQLRQFVGPLGHPRNVKWGVAMVSSSASQHSEESRLMMGETLSGPSNCTKPEKQPSCKRSSQLAFRSDIWENVETCFPIHSIAQYPPTSVFLSSQKKCFSALHFQVAACCCFCVFATWAAKTELALS